MIFYWIVIGIVLIQRGIELVIAKQNEARIKERGGVEFGEDHYRWIVLLHASFFLALTVEVWMKGWQVVSLWPLLLFIFLTVQIIRIWILASLGRYWNTKILVVPGVELVKKGPYRWVRHPNYWVVAIELVILPLLFQAWMTAVLFTILNALLLLYVRIPKEEEALRMLMESTD